MIWESHWLPFVVIGLLLGLPTLLTLMALIVLEVRYRLGQGSKPDWETDL